MKRLPILLVGLACGCAKLLGFHPGEPAETDGSPGGADSHEHANQAGAGGVGASDDTNLAGGDGGHADGGAQATRCGDHQLEELEPCDGELLNGASCASAGDFAGGTLRCTDTCEYDLGDCYAVESVAVAQHVCAVLTGGKLKCWGANYDGQLGLGDRFDRGEERNEMGAFLPFVDLGEDRVDQVTVGERHTCVLTSEHRVRCWGDNVFGQLGIPGGGRLISAAQAPAIDLGPGRIRSIAAGAFHNCALFTSGKVKCWGANSNGQLGLGDARDRGVEAGELGEQLPYVDLGLADVEQLSVGARNTCALAASGLKCWGLRSYDSAIPDIVLGDQPGEMGEPLPRVDLGWSGVGSVSAGGYHVCAVYDGAVKCWGGNSFSQLGVGDRLPRADLQGVAAQLPELELGGRAVALSAGQYHTCALLTDNRIKCWGGNGAGQLGLGDGDDRGSDAEDMGDALPAVDLGGSHVIIAVQAGGNTTCAILDGGRLKCWGENVYGALGLGIQGPVGRHPNQMGDALPFVEL